MLSWILLTPLLGFAVTAQTFRRTAACPDLGCVLPPVGPAFGNGGDAEPSSGPNGLYCGA